MQNVSVKYGSYVAVEGLNLSVEGGEILGLLGPNGAGKSTAMKAISGQITNYTGRIEIEGNEIKTLGRKLAQYVGIVPQEYSFLYDFQVEENLRFFGELAGIGKTELDERIRQLLEQLQLKEFAKKPAKDLSGGYKRLLNIAISILHNPKILLMDEPTVGLDPEIRGKIWKVIRSLKENGMTIVLTTHYLDEAKELCDRIAIVNRGKMLAFGAPWQIVKEFGGRTVAVLQIDSDVENSLNALEPEDGVRITISRRMISIICKREQLIRTVGRIAKELEKGGKRILDSVEKEPDLDEAFENAVGIR